MTTVHVHYFAVLRQCARRTNEARETSSADLAGLYQELRAAYDFPLPATRVRAAVGCNYVPMETALHDGMEVTFIPPVAGG